MAYVETAKQVYEAVKNPGELSSAQYQELIDALAAFFTGVALIAEDKKQADDQLPVMKNSLIVIAKITNKKLPELDSMTVVKKKKGSYEFTGGYEHVDVTTIVLGGLQHIKLGTDVAGLYNDLRQRYELIRNDLAAGHQVDDQAYINLTGYTYQELESLQLTESEFVQHLWSQRSSSTDTAQQKAEEMIKSKVREKLTKEPFDSALESVKHLVYIYNKAEHQAMTKVIEAEFDKCDSIYEPAQARIKLNELDLLVKKIESEIQQIQEHKAKRQFMSNLNIDEFTVNMQLKPLPDHPITGLDKYYSKAMHYKDLLVKTEVNHVAYCQLLEKITNQLDVFDIIYCDVAKALTIAIAMMVVCDRTVLRTHKTTVESLFNRLNDKFTVPKNVYSEGLDVNALISTLQV